MTNLSKQRELFDWLHSLDLSHHFDHFVENGYEDLDICREIGESDLQAIGVCDIHERISLLQAIRHSRQIQQSSFSSLQQNSNSNTNNSSNTTTVRDNYISTNYNYQECEEEPFYESVLPFEHVHVHDYESVPEYSSNSSSSSNVKNLGILWPNSTQSIASRPHLLPNSNSLHANLIPRTQLRDHVNQDGINISHVRSTIPDEVTLGAVATQYASELCSSQNAGEFLTFEQEIHHQLREMWLEERRKLVSQPGFSSSSSMLHGGSDSPVRRLATRGTFSTSNNCKNRKTSVPSALSSSSTLGCSGKQSLLHHPVPVPTVSGIVSSGSGGGKNSPFLGAERLVDTMTYRSPEHYPQHQYLQHVIISNENIGSGLLSSHTSHPLAEAQNNLLEDRPIYTPGIYLPSSCLLDKDEIYDYAPPLQRNHCSPSKRFLQSPFKSKPKSKTSLSCYHGTSQTSPSRRQYATIRNCSNNKSMSRSVSLNVNHTSPTYVNTSTLLAGDFSKSASSSSSHGCRTLTNLSKLSRRLGLSRFFRTFRTHGSGSNSCQNSKLMTMSTTTTQSKPSSSNRQLVSSSIKVHEDGIGESSCTLSSLPSNERIIETINRLKYEELQKRKERIAQEHQMILKELKNSMSPSTNSSDGPSSIFYVSNSNSNDGGTDEEAGAMVMPMPSSVSSPQHHNQQQQKQQSLQTYYDQPYENEHETELSTEIDNFNSTKIKNKIHKSQVNDVISEMGSKHSKNCSMSGSLCGNGNVFISGKDRRSWTTEYQEPGNGSENYHHHDHDPTASNRTSSSSNYHSNSTSESISSGDVNGLGIEPENISNVGDGRIRNCREVR